MHIADIVYKNQTVKWFKHPLLEQWYLEFSDGQKLFYDTNSDFDDVEENVYNYLTLLSNRV